MQEVIFQNWGLIDYQEAWDKQELLFNEAVARKVRNRDLPPEQQEKVKHHLIFCEHPHVFTLGKSGKPEHLLLSEEGLTVAQANYYKINRGGDITYHGPGQLVVYPIFDLDHFFTDIHKYLRFLEEAVIKTLDAYGIAAGRIDKLTGVWLEHENPLKARKVCAMGVRCSRWVTMHGLALNVNADLSYFGHIIPCGITDKAVASMHTELGRKLDMEEIGKCLLHNITEIFQVSIAEGQSALQK